jgi:hypothetical protein
MARSSSVSPLREGPWMAIHSPTDNENEAGLRRFVRRPRTDRSRQPFSRSQRSARRASACVVTLQRFLLPGSGSRRA